MQSLIISLAKSYIGRTVGGAEEEMMRIYLLPCLQLVYTRPEKDIWNDVITKPLSHVLLKYKLSFDLSLTVQTSSRHATALCYRKDEDLFHCMKENSGSCPLSLEKAGFLCQHTQFISLTVYTFSHNQITGGHVRQNSDGTQKSTFPQRPPIPWQEKHLFHTTFSCLCCRAARAKLNQLSTPTSPPSTRQDHRSSCHRPQGTTQDYFITYNWLLWVWAKQGSEGFCGRNVVNGEFF